jgi:hypothetical protein
LQGEARRYRVIEAVGRGGFGTVYKAALLGPGDFRKTVALKVLNPELAEHEDIAARLRDEARMLGLLQHRAVVRVDGLQRLGDRWAVVMEFVEGVDLKRILQVTGPVPVGPTLEIVAELASGLDGAYTTVGEDGTPLNLLHRDVKPSNVRLTRNGEVKVLDFGVARAEFSGRESTTRSLFFGSLAYMAPERLDGIDTHKGDVYGCGAVLYELLVGEPLGRTSGNRERHEARLTEALAALWAALPDEAVYRTIGACLAYDESDRPDARTLARHLRSLRKERAGPWLQDWAQQTLPGIPPLEIGGAEDDLSGTIVAEDAVAISGTLAGPTRAPRRSPVGPMVVAAGFSFALVVALGLGLVGWVWSIQEAELDALDLGGGAVVEAPPPDALAPAADDDAADILAGGDPASDTPEPVDAAPAEPAPAEPAPARATPPTRAVAPAQVADPEPVADDAPDPEPDPKPAVASPPVSGATARILLAGGAKAVRLSGRKGDFDAGAVPPGTYAIDADFGAGFKSAGTVRVSEGEVAQLVCRSSLGRCRKR